MKTVRNNLTFLLSLMLLTHTLGFSSIAAPTETAAKNDSSSSEKKEEGGGSIANQILALGTGVIGSNILLSCKLGGVTPSIMAFGAGSLVYIGSEIAGAKAQQAFIKVKKDEIAQLKATMTEGGDLQRGIIEAKLKEEEDKLGFVKKRKMWTMAVSAIYGAATGLAAMEFACITNKITLPACTQWVVAGCEGGSSLPSSTLLSGAIVGAYGFAVGNAGGTAVSRYGTALAAGLGVVVPSVSAKVAIAYQTPKTRMVTFGIGTALAATVMMELSKIQKDLESNISDLKTLLADYSSKTQDVSGIKDGAGAVDLAKDNLNLMQGSGSVNRMAIGADLNKHCWGKDDQGRQTYSDDACNNALKLAKPKYNSKFNLPTLQSVANTGVDMAQAVASGDMGAADIAAANLASNAMRVNEIKDKLIKDINDQEKKNGKKPFDYNKAVDDGIASMKKDLTRGLARNGVNLASLSPSDSSLASMSKALAADDEVNATGGEVGQDAILLGADDSMDINLDEGMSEGEMGFSEGDNTVAATHTLEDFETQESDILAKPEESIFKQLSNRYLLNYGRIFESKGPETTSSK